MQTAEVPRDKLNTLILMLKYSEYFVKMTKHSVLGLRKTLSIQNVEYGRPAFGNYDLLQVVYLNILVKIF